MDINLPVSAPVNNNIQTNIYDKLDQLAFEKIRVANSQLDTRLSIQARILSKHRKDIERIHAHQTQRLRREVKKIRKKKPDYIHDDSEISVSRTRAETEIGRKRCLSEPPSNLSYCRRFYSHHYSIGEERCKRKEKESEKSSKKDSPNDFFNLGFRLYFLNMMSNTSEPAKSEQLDLGASLDSSFGRLNGCNSYQANRRDRSRSLNTQSSVDESDEDDVFGNSHSSFKSSFGNMKQRGSADCLAEINETPPDAIDGVDRNIDVSSDVGLTGNSDVMALEGDSGEAIENRHETIVGGEQIEEEETFDLNNHLVDLRDTRTGSVRRNRRRESKASNTELVNYGEGLRKSKRAFEKIFAGLL